MTRGSLEFVVQLLAILAITCDATKHNFVTKNDSRYLIAPIGHPFGFLKGGVYNLTIFDYDMQSKGEDDLGDFQSGFLLKRYSTEKAFALEQNEILNSNGKKCIFHNFTDRYADNNEDPMPSTEGNQDDQLVALGEGVVDKSANGIFISMKNKDKMWAPNAPTVSHRFSVGEEGLYFLVYQLCLIDTEQKEGDKIEQPRDLRSRFKLDVTHVNYDSFGNISYLTAGEIPLPRMFFYFSFSYFLLLLMWVANIRNIMAGEEGVGTKASSSQGSGLRGSGKAAVYTIHHMMAILLGLKAVTIFSESVRYHYIRVYGHAELWSVIYYFFAFLKGTFLFTLILLIGSGWSFVKPFLYDREKKVIFVVLFLQVIDNIAVVVLTHETEGERLYDDWTAVLHLVDIVCCCAVLVPIVWQINNLERQFSMQTENEENEETDDQYENDSDAARMMEKLKLFRSFYLLVIGYIYFTRIVVFIFATTLGYRHTWLRYLVTELGTLSFYLVVGMKFRPMAENPYLAVKRDSDDIKEEKIHTSSLEMGTYDIPEE